MSIVIELQRKTRLDNADKTWYSTRVALYFDFFLSKDRKLSRVSTLHEVFDSEILLSRETKTQKHLKQLTALCSCINFRRISLYGSDLGVWKTFLFAHRFQNQISRGDPPKQQIETRSRRENLSLYFKQLRIHSRRKYQLTLDCCSSSEGILQRPCDAI